MTMDTRNTSKYQYNRNKIIKIRNTRARIANKSDGDWKMMDKFLFDDSTSDPGDEVRSQATINSAVKTFKTVTTNGKDKNKGLSNIAVE